MLAYEELRGAAGREVYYRPPRYEARELFPSALPKIRVRTGVHRLHDLSLGGVSIIVNDTGTVDFTLGESVPLTI